MYVIDNKRTVLALTMREPDRGIGWDYDPRAIACDSPHITRWLETIAAYEKVQDEISMWRNDERIRRYRAEQTEVK